MSRDERAECKRIALMAQLEVRTVVARRLLAGEYVSAGHPSLTEVEGLLAETLERAREEFTR